MRIDIRDKTADAGACLFVAPELRRSGLGRALVRHATAQAPELGRRAVLDVGQTLPAAIALYESGGWTRTGELHIPLDDLDPPAVLDLRVYVSPDVPLGAPSTA